MDSYLLDKVRETTPKMNKAVVDGLAVKHFEMAEQWIEHAYTVVAKHFPPGLKFKGLHRCSPEEEYLQEPRQKLRNNATKSVVDVAQSDIYMTYLKFELNGVDLAPCPMFLPYVSDAGSISLSGSRFFISPVLSDIVFSYEPDKIFARFTRDKFSIYRLAHSAVIDQERVERLVSWAVLYHDTSERSKSARAREMRRVSLIHYLFIKHGFKETFRKYGFANIEVGDVNTINEFTHPHHEWVIASSAKPTSRLFTGGSHLVVAIPRKEYEANKDALATMLVSMFYTADRFPVNLTKDTVEEPGRYHWKVTMGKSLWDTSRREAEMPDDIDKHFSSLDMYVDDLLRPSLERIGLAYENLYDLMGHVMINMHKWILETPLRSISMYDKELSVLYEVFGSFKKSFIPRMFMFFFAVTNEAVKAGDTPGIKQTNLTPLAVNKLLKFHLKPRMVFQIRSNPANVSSMNYSGDHKFFKITSVLVRQKENTKSKEGAGEALLRIHTSSPDAGSIIQLPKKNPNGQTRVSPFITLEDDMYIVPNPNLQPLLHSVQTRIDAALSTNFSLRDDALKDGVNMDDDDAATESD